MLASEFLALTESCKCTGNHNCHWCGAPCTEDWIHDGPPNLPFIDKGEYARCRSENWICKGCWLWRRKSISVQYLHGLICDRRCARDHSWLVTDKGSWVLGLGDDWEQLIPILLKPPAKFFLSIINEPKTTNLLQCCVVNENFEIQNDTELMFTLNNIPMKWSVYELEDALTGGDPNGRPAGVQALATLLAPALGPSGKIEKEVIKRGRGRPPKPEPRSEGPYKLVRASGM
jgi:hypothetical protein